MGGESNAKLDVENVFLHGKELLCEEIVGLREHLYRFSVKEIKFIEKSLSIHLTGSSKKADIIEQLMAMAQIGAIQKHQTREEDVNISYLTQKISKMFFGACHCFGMGEKAGFIERFHLHEFACVFGVWTG